MRGRAKSICLASSNVTRCFVSSLASICSEQTTISICNSLVLHTRLDHRSIAVFFWYLSIKRHWSFNNASLDLTATMHLQKKSSEDSRDLAANETSFDPQLATHQRNRLLKSPHLWMVHGY